MRTNAPTMAKTQKLTKYKVSVDISCGLNLLIMAACMGKAMSPELTSAPTAR
jgi:hypothetical protein